MTRHLVTQHIWAASLLALAALTAGSCQGGVSSASGTTPESTNADNTAPAPAAKTVPRAVGGPLTPVEVAAFVYGVDSALSDMFTFQTPPKRTNNANPTAVNVTSACSTAFASDGNIVVQGTLTWGATGAADAFSLTMNFSRCPLKGDDGTLYTFDANNVVVEGTVTSTTNADDSVTDVYAVSKLTGSLDESSSADMTSCDVDATDAATYAWGDSLQVTGHYSGTFCQTSQTGTVSRLLPVTVP